MLAVGEKETAPVPELNWEDQEERDRATAERMRAVMESLVPEVVCSVCGGWHCEKDSTWHLYDTIAPLLEVLRTDVPATLEIPRDGSNTWVEPVSLVEYCMLADPRARCIAEDATAGGQAHAVRICRTCLVQLAAGKVPRFALARVDLGMWPVGARVATLLESMAASPVRAYRMTVFLRAPGCVRPLALLQTGMRAHLMLTFAPGPDALLRTIPQDPKQLGESLCIVFIGPVANEEEARHRAASAPLFFVRGEVVVELAWRLRNNMGKFYRAPDIRYDAQQAQEWLRVRGVPPGLLEDMLVSASAEEALRLQRGLRSDLTGYARTRYEAVEPPVPEEVDPRTGEERDVDVTQPPESQLRVRAHFHRPSVSTAIRAVAPLHPDAAAQFGWLEIAAAIQRSRHSQPGVSAEQLSHHMRRFKVEYEPVLQSAARNGWRVRDLLRRWAHTVQQRPAKRRATQAAVYSQSAQQPPSTTAVLQPHQVCCNAVRAVHQSMDLLMFSV